VEKPLDLLPTIELEINKVLCCGPVVDEIFVDFGEVRING